MSNTDGTERYFAKREAGISPLRKDGSRTAAETDRQAAAAEKWAAEQLGQNFNDEIYATRGDGGSDFDLHGWSIEVIHLGMTDNYTQPRTTGNLIVNPHEPQRWADLYVVVRGSVETGFGFCGWYFHDQLVNRPRRDFGFGSRFCCPIAALNPIDILLDFHQDVSK